MVTQKIRVDSGTPLATILGFTDDLFYGWFEIHTDNNWSAQTIYLFFINSRHENKGNTTRLLQFWLSAGFDVRVVRPVEKTKRILQLLGFKETLEEIPDHYNGQLVEVWCKS